MVLKQWGGGGQNDQMCSIKTIKSGGSEEALET